MAMLPYRRKLTDTGVETIQGIALVTAAYMGMSLGDGSVKWALPAAGLAGAMIGRAVFGMPTVALVARLQGRGGWRRLRPVRWPLVLLRSVLHCASALCWYLAWNMHMALADSYAVGFCTPLIMTLAAVPLLHERLRLHRVAAIALGFMGVLVMLRPGGELWTPATGVMVLGLFPLAGSRILIRFLATTETAECLTFWMIAMHLPMGLLVWVFAPIPGLTWAALVALVVNGLCNGVAHWLQSRAFALAPIGALAPYEYTSLLWGTAVGWVLFAELPKRDALLGAAIVIAASLYNLHREQLRRRAELDAAALAGRGPAAPGAE